MMKMSFELVAKKLFGVRYERLTWTLFLDVVVFWGLHISGFRVAVSPFILYLMTGVFSAGIMWQALSSGDNRENLKNAFMLPFDGRTLVVSYVWFTGLREPLAKTAYQDIWINFTGLFIVLSAASAVISKFQKRRGAK